MGGRRGGRLLALLLVAALGASGCGDDGGGPATDTTEAASPAVVGAPLPPNPHLGPAGTATMHGDSGSSDTTALAGPSPGPVEVSILDLGTVYPTILVGGDGHPVALCTRIADLRPVVHLLDPRSGSSLASIELTTGGLFGGVYGYLDEADRMVLVDGAADLLRIGHRRTGGRWVLEIDQRTALAGVIPPGDTVTSVAPDYGGEVWFATEGGTVGLVDTADESVRTTRGPASRWAPRSSAVASDRVPGPWPDVERVRGGRSGGGRGRGGHGHS